jgi:hypothetical protein
MFNFYRFGCRGSHVYKNGYSRTRTSLHLTQAARKNADSLLIKHDSATDPLHSKLQPQKKPDIDSTNRPPVQMGWINPEQQREFIEYFLEAEAQASSDSQKDKHVRANRPLPLKSVPTAILVDASASKFSLYRFYTSNKVAEKDYKIDGMIKDKRVPIVNGEQILIGKWLEGTLADERKVSS